MTDREREMLGTIEGLTNWMASMRELVVNTDCNPEDPDEFDEILICCNLQQMRGEEILKKYGFRE